MEGFADVGLFRARRYVKGGSIFIEIPFGSQKHARRNMKIIKGEKIDW